MPSENKPRICTIFYCDRRRKSVCCSDCGFRRRGCYNSCKNDPAKCGLCKAPDLEGAEGIDLADKKAVAEWDGE